MINISIMRSLLFSNCKNGSCEYFEIGMNFNISDIMEVGGSSIDF